MARSMEKIFEHTYHRQEKNHWWLKGRRRSICSLLRTVPKNARILDVGCAGGQLLHDLHELGFVDAVGVDTSQAAVDACRDRGLSRVARADAASLPFDAEQFDIIIASDILEHVEDDEAALREWGRVLASSGMLIVYSPAFPSLWSSHDVTNHHFRRYTKDGLARALLNNGFKVKKIGYWNFVLFFPTYVVRLFQKIIGGLYKNSNNEEEVRTYPILNTVLNALLWVEHIINRAGINFPCGVSVYAIAIK